MTQLFLRSFPRRLARAVVCLALAAVSTGAFALDPDALPTGGQVAAGSAAVTAAGGGALIVQNSSSAVIDWQTFNVGTGAQVSFNQPAAGAVILNRVINSGNQIYGRLTATGTVSLESPAGVVLATSVAAGTVTIGSASFGGQDWSLAPEGLHVSLGSTVTGVASSAASDVLAISDAAFDAIRLTRADQTMTGIPLNPGWNLVGNSGGAGFDVATLFGDAAKVVSVWKWGAANSRWAFYSPTLTADELAAYAQRNGYDVLARVEAGEGIWVNAAQAFLAVLPEGTALPAATLRSRLVPGWNLVSVGERQTPAELNAALGTVSGADLATPPAPGDVKSIWAWDNQRGNWYFHAPELDKRGTLAAYVAGKSYIDFAATRKTLGPGVGFWVNKADKIPLTITATGIDRVYDGTTTAQVTLSDNRVAGDILEIVAASANFSDRHVGVGKTIQVTGITVTGKDAGKYTFNTTATATADIARATLNIRSSDQTRIYGCTNAATASASVVWACGGQSVGGLSATDAGHVLSAGNIISGDSISFTDNAAGNYAVTSLNAGAVTITPMSYTLTYSLAAVPASSTQPTATTVQP